MLWTRAISLWALVVLFLPWGSGAADTNSLNLEEFKIPIWNHSFELRGGAGYKDNVLLSNTNAEDSAFWMSGAEAMIFSLPNRGWQFNFFADATDVRYFDAPSVDSEQLALAAAQLNKDLGQGWKSTLGLNYLFQNQVFDASTTYTTESSVGKILGHTLAPRWAARKKLNQFWIEGEINATRQWLDEPLDDYWQVGPRLVGGYGWRNGSELTLAGQWQRLDYDSREQADSLGAPLPETSLGLDTQLLDLAWTQVWDEKRHWTTVTSIGYEACRDNGSGYYDFNDYRLSQQVRFRDQRWEVTARARVGYYEYSTQTVSDTDTGLRRKTMVSALLRVERKFGKHFKGQISYHWDQSISNLDFDDYQANVVTAGLGITF